MHIQIWIIICSDSWRLTAEEPENRKRSVNKQQSPANINRQGAPSCQDLYYHHHPTLHPTGRPSEHPSSQHTSRTSRGSGSLSQQLLLCSDLRCFQYKPVFPVSALRPELSARFSLWFQDLVLIHLRAILSLQTRTLTLQRKLQVPKVIEVVTLRRGRVSPETPPGPPAACPHGRQHVSPAGETRATRDHVHLRGSCHGDTL